MGDKQKYDRKKLVPAICKRLSTGEPLAVILRELKLNKRTVNHWREEDEGIAEQFDDARDLGYDAIAARLRETARGRADSTADVQRDKLIIDTDLKLLAKWDPRRYGDKTAVDHTSSDGTMTPKGLSDFYAGQTAKPASTDA